MRLYQLFTKKINIIIRYYYITLNIIYGWIDSLGFYLCILMDIKVGLLNEF